jgi:hypothetical protein
MTKKLIDEGPYPTPYENFLYLLVEMEGAVDRGHIRWPAGEADVIVHRLARIAQKVALASNLDDSTRPN